MENLSLDLSGKISFSVFQFCLRNSSGTFPETKLKNWKTEKLFFYGESLPGCLWKKQFFSFSVLLTEVFRNIPHFLVVQCMSYIFIYELDMWPPKRSLPNLEVKMCLKHCKNQCFFEKCRFWGVGPPYIVYYIEYRINIPCIYIEAPELTLWLFWKVHISFLKLTANPPENGMAGIQLFPLGIWPFLRCELLVSGWVYIYI